MSEIEKLNSDGTFQYVKLGKDKEECDKICDHLITKAKEKYSGMQLHAIIFIISKANLEGYAPPGLVFDLSFGDIFKSTDKPFAKHDPNKPNTIVFDMPPRFNPEGKITIQGRK